MTLGVRMENTATATLQKRTHLIDYIRIARIDHWFKNIFMVPGIVLALLFANVSLSGIWQQLLLAIISTCLAASANYVINEWLDAEFDRFHPDKKKRPAACGKVVAHYVYLEYALLVIASLSVGLMVGSLFAGIIVFFLIMGALYNIKPFRTKDRMYMDVLSESVNNPIRLLLGWTAIVTTYLPPISIILAYWMGGAFLMASKRFAEYRHINNPELAGNYRRSFKFYNEQNLLVSCFFYALASSFFLGVFLIKYRIELLLTLPLYALLFSWYLSIALKPDSPVQRPETLYTQPKFIAYLVFLLVVTGALFVVDIPWLQFLVEPSAIA